MTNKLPIIAGCMVAMLPVVQQQPVFRGRVDLVAVDVHVVDASGRPVADLRAEDFTLKVDGKPRPIVAADYVSHGVTSTSVPARQPSASRGPLFSSNTSATSGAPGRTLLLVVDESNIGAGNGHWAMTAAERFLDQMGPADRVGLALIPYARANIDLTTDHAAVREALQHIVGHLHTVQPESSHSLGLVEAFAFANDDRRTWREVIRRECVDVFPTLSPEEFVRCTQLLEADARRMVSDARQRLLESVRSFVALLTALGQLPGPKTLILISEELPVSPYLVDRKDFSAEASQITAAAARAQASVYVVQLHTPLFDVETRQAPPTTTADADIRASGLEEVTSLTGGTRQMVSGRPEVAFDRIALEISGYYLLGFRAEPADRDGRPHDIAVEVRRPGVHVRARKMFAFADAMKSRPDASATDVVNRLLRTPAEATDLPLAVATYALPAPGQGPPRVQVIISAEIDRAVEDAAAVTVGYILFGATGKNAGASVEQVTLKPARAKPGGPLCYLAAAIVPPGDYTMRFAAADDTLRAGSVEHRFGARLTEVGGLRVSDLIIHDPDPTEAGGARASVSAAVRDALTASLELGSSSPGLPPGITVSLEVAASLDGPPLAGGEMTLQASQEERRFQAGGSVPLSGIPPGDYVGRAVVSFAGGVPAARVMRPVRITEPSAPGVSAGTPKAPSPAVPPAAAAPPPGATPAIAPPAAAPPAAAVTSAIARPAPARTVEEAVERAGRYVVDYGEQMSLIIGVERYAQWMENADFVRPVTKQLVSEFALVRVKDDWLGFRDVHEADGKPVGDRQDRLEKLFLQSRSAGIDQGRQIAQESARYNMGAIQRNFNVPTTALFFLQPANLARFRFKKSGEDSIDGVAVWKVGYEETRKPTIIRTSGGKDMPLKGMMWIDPADGRVFKTRMEILSEARLTAEAPMSTDPGGFGDLQASQYRKRGAGDDRRVLSSASITVTYRQEPRFGLLVPSVMLETYEGPSRSRFTGQESVTRINCRATYSEFKRFETSGRIVVPK